MNILIDTRLSNNSGIGRVIRNIISGVTKKGWNVLCLGGERIESSSLYFPWDATLYSLREQLGCYTIRKAAREGALLYAPHFNWPVFGPAPDILTVNDLIHLQFPQFFGSIRINALKFLLEINLRRARFIHCPSDATASELINRYPFTKRKIRIVHYGIESRFFKKVDDGSKTIIDSPYFLSIGNIKPHKNLDRLIEAFICFQQSRTDIRLVIVGRDFMSQELRQKVNSRGLSKYIEFFGEVDEGKLLELYYGAMALIHPSLMEGFGFTPLEAMAIGTPVLCSKAGSLPEVCGESVIYFNPLDIYDIVSAMIKISSDSRLRSAMSGNGVKHALKFTWDKCISGFTGICHEALNEK